jgi:hypothetical protein
MAGSASTAQRAVTECSDDHGGACHHCCGRQRGFGARDIKSISDLIDPLIEWQRYSMLCVVRHR